MAKISYEVIIPSNHKIRPTELDAAQILANHFKASVKVLCPATGYMQKSADFIIDDISYELKSPTTSKISSIEKIIRLASRQSGNVVIDMRKTKITEKRMIELCNDRLKNIKRLKKVVLIVNSKKVLEFRK